VRAAFAEAQKDESTKVTLAHLKKVAETDDRFGFLLSSLGGVNIVEVRIGDDDRGEPDVKKLKP
jgi:hypothetical protein